MYSYYRTLTIHAVWSAPIVEIAYYLLRHEVLELHLLLHFILFSTHLHFLSPHCLRQLHLTKPCEEFDSFAATVRKLNFLSMGTSEDANVFV